MNDAQLRDRIINFVIDKVEGGFTNDPADPGGPTNWGITLKTYANFFGRDPSTVTAEEIRKMPKATAVHIYEELFWKPLRCDAMPAEIRHIAFDMCVNHGRFNAVKLIQRTLQQMMYHVGVDGGIGPATLQALHDAVIKFGAGEVLHGIVDARKDFYKAIVANKPSQKKFYDGWINRDEWFLSHSLIDGL